MKSLKIHFNTRMASREKIDKLCRGSNWTANKKSTVSYYTKFPPAPEVKFRLSDKEILPNLKSVLLSDCQSQALNHLRILGFFVN